MELVVLAGGRAQRRDTHRQVLEHDPHLQPRERRAEPEVDAFAECDVVTGVRAADVELIGLAVVAGVVTRGGKE